jgi:hypothetical protein
MNQQQVKLNITLDKTVGVICEECGGNVFTDAMLIRKASKFLIGAEQDAIIPIPVFACVGCNHVNDEFMPKSVEPKEEDAE